IPDDGALRPLRDDDDRPGHFGRRQGADPHLGPPPSLGRQDLVRHPARAPLDRCHLGGRPSRHQTVGIRRGLSRQMSTSTYRATAASASSSVKAPAYKAFPTIAPSTPSGTNLASVRRSSSDE